MRDSIRHFVAEFIGTFALVFIGGAAIINARMPNSGIGVLEIALAHGLTLAVLVSALMRVSGHFNPAVTIGFAATRRIAPLMAGIYLAAQIMAAIIAAYALRGLFPSDVFELARGGGQSVSLDITTGQAIGLEAIATFFLVFVVFGTAVDRHRPRLGGLPIGFTIVAGTLAIGPLTGGSMNPARSFGPAVVTGIFEGQVVYWIGPVVGGTIAALLYDWLFLRHGIEPVDHGQIETTH